VLSETKQPLPVNLESLFKRPEASLFMLAERGSGQTGNYNDDNNLQQIIAIHKLLQNLLALE
jgi:hypothetical protein